MCIRFKGLCGGGKQVAPTIEVSADGTITATAGKQVTTAQLSNANNPDFESANIVSGKSIFGVIGTHTCSAEQESPTISVSSSGLITATAGSLSTTKQLSTQSGTTITPGTSSKTAVSSGKYTTGTVYVAGDINLDAQYIKEGVSIFGIEGTYTGTDSSGGETTVQLSASDLTVGSAYIGFDLGVENIFGLTNFSLYANYNTRYITVSLDGSSNVFATYFDYDTGEYYIPSGAISLNSGVVRIDFDTDLNVGTTIKKSGTECIYVTYLTE